MQCKTHYIMTLVCLKLYLLRKSSLRENVDVLIFRVKSSIVVSIWYFKKKNLHSLTDVFLSVNEIGGDKRLEVNRSVTICKMERMSFSFIIWRRFTRYLKDFTTSLFYAYFTSIFGEFCRDRLVSAFRFKANFTPHLPSCSKLTCVLIW